MNRDQTQLEVRETIYTIKGLYRNIHWEYTSTSKPDNGDITTTFRWTAGLRGTGTADGQGECLDSIMNRIDESIAYNERDSANCA